MTDQRITAAAEEVAPCPFCGAKAFLSETFGPVDEVQILCNNFGDCRVLPQVCGVLDQAIAAWNRRVEKHFGAAPKEGTRTWKGLCVEEGVEPKPKQSIVTEAE